ncbi:HAD family hydrolase [Aquicella lusitana]|uniref:Haloacid dehalogenase-like hydrolase n=1 Tax=Aquicella lusitana TaxID=254246 RepID=A0A370G3V8_9COXI|nr:HAD family hydrolase [Aquicella lusitana]RDI38541.1 haloacid dehalogenase-like hydrolase [Aquicella lusitana]VVC74614.1 hypothetical protein AQULUS_23800 [Aquicella lusitana]
MDKVTQVRLQSMMQMSDKVRANDLLKLLEHFKDKIKVLSLDCFDTLIWRKTASPKDVFFDLQQRHFFQSMGFNASLRISAEGKSRQLSALKGKGGEVKLKDIYADGFHELTQEQINDLVKDELLSEKNACFAFPPVIELLKAARKTGIKVIIVSDTYFEEYQLKEMLSFFLPKDALEIIDKIFCSCEVGRSKTSGIFYDVIQYTRCSPEQILHIGDNPVADYLMPKAFKINAFHFIHQDDCIKDLIRLQDTAAKIIDPSINSVKPLYSPFRCVFSLQSFSKTNPEKFIGYASLGPIMYSFAHFLCNEVTKLKEKNKNPKVLFLMRDAYLPSMACETYLGSEIGKRVRISRFASYAASFMTPDDIDSYLIEIGATNRFHDVARQLLLPEKVYDPIIRVAEHSKNPASEFMKLIRRKDIVKIILAKSEQYRSRLIKHLDKQVGLEKGSTLVLVDLGYSGTAQRRLTPVFKALGIDVVGRYLLSLRVPGWEANRCGLIDPSWCDDNAMLTIVFYITLLEQLCTSNERSVIDYDENGDAIYSDIIMGDQQHQKLINIQSSCIQFVKDAIEFFRLANMTLSNDMLRQTAMTELCRMIFLPTEWELDYLKTFQAEMNLGTTDILRVFDPEQGLLGLRKRGMFYMEKPSKLTRTNYPAELRTAGIEFVLSLIAQHRFGLDLKLKDMVLRKEPIQVMFQQGTEVYKTPTEAVATHDGFFSVWLPANLKTFILLGERYEWIQIESAEFITMDAFVNQNEAQNTMDAFNFINFDQIENKGNNLYKLTSSTSSISFNPIPSANANEYVFRIVYRPIIKRADHIANPSETIQSQQMGVQASHSIC